MLNINIKKIKPFLCFLKEREFKIDLSINFSLLCLKNILRIRFRDNDFSDREIDILIPTITKDFELLEYNLKSLKNIKQKINKIYVVSKKEKSIEDFCIKNNLIFINEDEVFSFTKSQINYKVEGIDRSGWIFQQLLKLSGDKIVEKEDYLVVDSDTLLIGESSFIDSRGRYCLQQGYEYHKKYFENYEKLFKRKPANKFTAVCHMMIFNKKILLEMKKDIETINKGRKWFEAILDLIDNNEKSYFAEYETYANYLRSNYKKMTYLKPFYNKTLNRKGLDIFENLEKTYSKKYTSVSFHVTKIIPN